MGKVWDLGFGLSEIGLRLGFGVHRLWVPGLGFRV